MNSLTFKLYQVTIVIIEGGWKQFSKTTSNFIQSTSNPTFPLCGQPISHMLSYGLKFEIEDVAIAIIIVKFWGNPIWQYLGMVLDILKLIFWAPWIHI